MYIFYVLIPLNMRLRSKQISEREKKIPNGKSIIFVSHFFSVIYFFGTIQLVDKRSVGWEWIGWLFEKEIDNYWVVCLLTICEACIYELSEMFLSLFFSFFLRLLLSITRSPLFLMCVPLVCEKSDAWTHFVCAMMMMNASLDVVGVVGAINL